MFLHFVIPIRHPSKVHDPDEQYKTISQTIENLSHQQGDNWDVTIVANPETKLPPLPEKMSVKHVDLPPEPAFDTVETLRDFYRAVRKDKGTRVWHGTKDLPKDHYIMIVDDDDFVSPRLASTLEGEDAGSGWAITQGYAWDMEQDLVTKLDRFNKKCGTSLIVKHEHYMYTREASVSDKAIAELGSHQVIVERLVQAGQPLRPVPFRAAVYRLAHKNATQADIKTQGLSAAPSLKQKLRLALQKIRGAYRPKAFLKEHFGVSL